MTQYGYISVYEYEDGPKSGERFLKFGKGDSETSYLTIPTPDNDIESMSRFSATRLGVFDLPETNTADEIKRRWNDGELPESIQEAATVLLDADPEFQLEVDNE